MVLLENRGGALPLSAGTGKIAVIGPLADNPSDQLGPDQPIGYDVKSGKVVSVLDGIKKAAPHATRQLRPGVRPDCTSNGGFGAAVSAAQGADVTVVVRRASRPPTRARPRRAATSACPASSSRSCRRSPAPASRTWSC